LDSNAFPSFWMDLLHHGPGDPPARFFIFPAGFHFPRLPSFSFTGGGPLRAQRITLSVATALNKPPSRRPFFFPFPAFLETVRLLTFYRVVARLFVVPRGGRRTSPRILLMAEPKLAPRSWRDSFCQVFLGSVFVRTRVCGTFPLFTPFMRTFLDSPVFGSSRGLLVRLPTSFCKRYKVAPYSSPPEVLLISPPLFCC